MNLKTSLIATLSFLLLSCAGKPPVMEHPVKFYSGSPSRQSMCRRTQARMVAFVKEIAQHQFTADHAKEALASVMAPDGEDCVKASDPAFGNMLGLTAEDMRVLLQFQENLLYSCEKWRD